MIQLSEVITELKRLYPDADCTLDYDEPWKLLFNTRLAAQCTDARVNIVAGPLYAALPTLEAFAAAEPAEIEKLIRPCGFYHTKAADLKGCAQILLEKFQGRLPETLEEMLKLPGIGRKTANLVLGEVYGKPAVVTDTHCIRLANRLGLVDTDDPYKVEIRLRELVPEEEQLLFCHRLVHHGRAVCRARKPDCGGCTLSAYCATAPEPERTAQTVPPTASSVLPATATRTVFPTPLPSDTAPSSRRTERG